MKDKQIQQHIDNVMQYSCMVCGMSPVVPHHCRSGSMTRSGFLAGRKRPSDWLIIPLTPMYHNGDRGIHTMGVETWEGIYGTQMSHLIQLSIWLGYDLLDFAKRWHLLDRPIIVDNSLRDACQNRKRH